MPRAPCADRVDDRRTSPQWPRTRPHTRRSPEWEQHPRWPEEMAGSPRMLGLIRLSRQLLVGGTSGRGPGRARPLFMFHDRTTETHRATSVKLEVRATGRCEKSQLAEHGRLRIRAAEMGRVEHNVEHAQHQQRHHHRTDHAADDHGRQRPLHFSSHAVAERHRQKAQAGDESCHQHGSQSGNGRLRHGVVERRGLSGGVGGSSRPGSCRRGRRRPTWR